MRISDWSSDVCSSDLVRSAVKRAHHGCLDDMPLGSGRGLGRRRGGCGCRGGGRRRISDRRSEERRVGKECVGKCKSRWSTDNKTKKKKKKLTKYYNYIKMKTYAKEAIKKKITI